MLEQTIIDLSNFLTISTTLIPDIITIGVIFFFIILAFKSSLTTLPMVGLFTIVMGLLELIGISSSFNILSLILEAL